MNGVVFQCANCRALTVASSVTLDGERVGLACTQCNAYTMLPVAGRGSHDGASARVVVDVDSARAQQPWGEPRGLPPSSALATTSGAALGNAGGFSADVRERIGARLSRLAPSNEEQATLAARFDALLDRWGAQPEHKKLLQSASAADQLAFVGQRYRAVLDEVPNDAASKSAQNDILGLAMAALAAKKDLGATEAGSSAKGIQIAAAAVIAIAFALAAIWLVPRLLPPGAGGATIIEEPAR